MNPANRKKWLNVVKWLWTVVVVAGVVWYFSKNSQASIAYIKNISIFQFALSAALLVVGKLFLAELSRLSVLSETWKPSFGKMFHLYSTIQLSKYLPGGVWHFVGRFGVYRINGLDNREAGQSILVENIWLLSSAVLFGGVACATNRGLLDFIGFPSGAAPQVGLIALLLAVWVAVNLLSARILLKRRMGGGALLSQILLQSAVWVFIGLSFFVLLPPRIMNMESATLSTGAFAIGWALGYVTIFAPSGIGIREAVITAILATYILPQEAAIYAALSRLVWVVTEIVLSIFSELVFGSGSLKTLLRPRQEDKTA